MRWNDRNLYPIGDNPHKVTENRWIDESNVYEQKKLIEEYLQLHYGRDDEVLPYPFTGLGELALNFPRRCTVATTHRLSHARVLCGVCRVVC